MTKRGRPLFEAQEQQKAAPYKKRTDVKVGHYQESGAAVLRPYKGKTAAKMAALRIPDKFLRGIPRYAWNDRVCVLRIQARRMPQEGQEA